MIKSKVKAPRGYTLLELVLAMALGAMALFAVATLAVSVSTFYAQRTAEAAYDREADYLYGEIRAWVDASYVRGDSVSVTGDELILTRDGGEFGIRFDLDEGRLITRAPSGTDAVAHLYEYSCVAEVTFECTDGFIKVTVVGDGDGAPARAFSLLLDH